MPKKTLLFTLILTLALSVAVIVFFADEKVHATEAPKELYQVYLDGDKIGVISSKAKLEQYINKQQEAIKKQFNVKNVYPPKNLNIQKYISYGDKVLNEKEVYSIIKKKSPFTIKGYVIKIKGDQEKIINVINKQIFTAAVTKTIEAFVPKEQYELFKTDKQAAIETTGKLIERIYLKESVTIKQAYIPTTSNVFIDELQLSKYLLFGTTADQGKYTVRAGDTLEQIAFNHQLGTDEFLLVNPKFSDRNTLLSPGQEVSIGSIRSILSVIVEEHVVEDQVIRYETETIYDNTLASGTVQTRQVGVDGIQRVVQKRQLTNGLINNVQIDRASSKVLKTAVNQIIVKGTMSSGGTIIVSSDGNWVWPTNSPYVISSPYGYRWGVLHDGLDIYGAGYGSPIRAARAGVVYQSSSSYLQGPYIIIAHDNNYYTGYLHLSKKYVSEGQTVTAGQVIGGMGNTGGHSTGTHLHFFVYIGVPYKAGSVSFNPLKLYR